MIDNKEYVYDNTLRSVNNRDKFLIIEQNTKKVIESWPTSYQAYHFRDRIQEIEKKKGFNVEYKVVFNPLFV